MGTDDDIRTSRRVLVKLKAKRPGSRIPELRCKINNRKTDIANQYRYKTCLGDELNLLVIIRSNPDFFLVAATDRHFQALAAGLCFTKYSDIL